MKRAKPRTLMSTCPRQFQCLISYQKSECLCWIHHTQASPCMCIWLSDNSIAFSRWWTHRGRVAIDRLSTALRRIGAFRLLQLHTLLLTSKITLILSVALVVVPLIRNGGGVHGWCLVAIGEVWLRGSAGVLSWCVAWRWCPCCPTSAAKGRVTKAATSTCCNAPEQLSVWMFFSCCVAGLRENHENKERSNH